MNNPLVQPDPGLFIWTIVTFLVLVTILAKFAWRPLLAALETRQAQIRKSLDDAAQAKVDLERLNHEAAQLMNKARADAEAVIARGQSDADRLREEMKQKSKADADIKRVDAKLSNEKFVANAPEEIVEEEKAKREEAQARREKILEALERLKGAV